MTLPPPGWHADPNDPTSWRYWDGARWTDNRAPKGTPQQGGALVGWGYATAILFPFIGAIIGIALMMRGDRNGGWVLGASLLVFTLAVLVLAGG